MPNLLILSRYDRQGASSRLRFLQYIPDLEKAGFDVTVASFFDAEYLTKLYSKKRIGLGFLKYFLHRFKHLLQARSADVIWIEKEALPWLPWSVERLFYPKNTPIVSDYDDAIFHQYDLHSRAIIRRVLGFKISSVMAHSDIVFAGNSYLEDHAKNAGTARHEIIPTVVDINAYQPKPQHLAHTTVGWIGTPETWNRFGVPMVDLLQNALQPHGAHFHAVGALSPPTPIPHFNFLPWSENTEISHIQRMDIGIMPLPDTPWARGKCGYKLIQYMACGLPVIASPVGVNADIVEHGVNGFLAQTDQEWHDALLTLLENPDLRQKMGSAGRRKVEQAYSLQTYGPKIANLLLDLT